MGNSVLIIRYIPDNTNYFWHLKELCIQYTVQLNYLISARKKSGHTQGLKGLTTNRQITAALRVTRSMFMNIKHRIRIQ
jgi:hypothetical protein